MSNIPDQVYDRIVAHLTDAGVAFRSVVHKPTLTSEDSARARGEPLSVGAKALLLKCDGAFRLVVIAADRKLQSRMLKNALRVRDVRFATRDELMGLTGLVPGSVPPFGEPILPFALYADVSVGAAHQRVAFNAGDLTKSIIMAVSDWERIAAPVRIACSELVGSPPA